MCMDFGIFKNKIILIEISSSKFYFMNIFLDFLKKVVKIVQSRFKRVFGAKVNLKPTPMLRIWLLVGEIGLWIIWIARN